MPKAMRDQEVEAVVRSAILPLFEKDSIDHIEVAPAEDQAGDPSLSVTIFLRAARENMPGSLLLDTIAAVARALREIDDSRFPYVTFLAPEYERSEDPRPTA